MIDSVEKWPNLQSSERKKGYKKGVDQDDARRGRIDTTVRIRKEKKEDQFNKRRGAQFDDVSVVLQIS